MYCDRDFVWGAACINKRSFGSNYPTFGADTPQRLGKKRERLGLVPQRLGKKRECLGLVPKGLGKKRERLGRLPKGRKISEHKDR